MPALRVALDTAAIGMRATATSFRSLSQQEKRQLMRILFDTTNNGGGGGDVASVRQAYGDNVTAMCLDHTKHMFAISYCDAFVHSSPGYEQSVRRATEMAHRIKDEILQQAVAGGKAGGSERTDISQCIAPSVAMRNRFVRYM